MENENTKATPAAAPAAPGTKKPTLAARPATKPAAKAPAKPAAAPKPVVAKVEKPAKEVVAKEPKEPKTPTRTIKGQDYTAAGIYTPEQAELVTRISRALREADITAAMRKSKRKGQVRLFILSRHLKAHQAKIEGIIANPPEAKAKAEPATETTAS